MKETASTPALPVPAVEAAMNEAVDRVTGAMRDAQKSVSEGFNQAEQALEGAMLKGVEHVERVKTAVDERVESFGEQLAPHFEEAMARGAVQVERVRTAVDERVGAFGDQFAPQVEKTRSAWRRWLRSVVNWFDTSQKPVDEATLDRIDWLRVMPFIGVHIACIGVFFVPFSWVAVGVGVFLYLLRMHAITGWYHRYFSHKAFKTSRVWQTVWAVIGASSAQRGPLWWAAHHRDHHRHSDTPKDLHSPMQRGFWMAHMGWFMTGRGFITHSQNIPDLNKYPELRWIDRYDVLFPTALGFLCFYGGKALEAWWPELGVTGGNLLFWGFFVSTIVLFHGTVTINSLSHTWGSRRYATKDDSRNNWFLAIVTLGEGWHNNHHHFPGSARQGFFWWEYDVTYYLLKASSWVGLVWDLKPVPDKMKTAGLIRKGE